jgi:tetratricopeptide (TPR) repeat protein
VALINRANQETAAGRHDTAAASLERAIAIEPGNAWLWHRLASARLAGGRVEDAASLAARSTALAIGDAALQARNWRLIADVHRQRGDEDAARDAERRARELEARSS